MFMKLVANNVVKIRVRYIVMFSLPYSFVNGVSMNINKATQCAKEVASTALFNQ